MIRGHLETWLKHVMFGVRLAMAALLIFFALMREWGVKSFVYLVLAVMLVVVANFVARKRES